MRTQARSEAFFERDMIPSADENSGFVVRNIKADFLATSKLGDILTVTSKIQTLKSTSLTLLQEVYKKQTKVFSMEVTLVYVDSGKPKRIPEEFKTLLNSFV